MKISRALVLLLAIVLNVSPVFALLHRGSAAAINRILIVTMGQSNMGTFTTNCTAPCTPANNAPNPLPNTFVLSGGSLITPSETNGLATMQNNVATATGLPNVSIPCVQSGSGINGFISGTGFFTTCTGLVNSIITPSDKVFVVWDQGEGDTNAATKPGFYAPVLAQLHSDFAAAIGRTTTSMPWIIAQLSTYSDVPGSLVQALPPTAWQIIKNSQHTAPLYESGMLIFSHTQFDFTRTDGFHYAGNTGSLFEGQRYAQTINTIMGAASGYPVFNIASSATVDATHTTVTVTHTLGTDFTPTSGITSFEVSSDNGATWVTPSAGVRTNATTITLTHSSMTTTNARLVRYAWGGTPPDADINCINSCPPPTGLVHDNSSLSVPLVPTTWDLRSTPTGSTLPMPTFRDFEQTVCVSCNTTPGDFTTQTLSGVFLGPDGNRKMIVFSFVGPAIDALDTPLSTITIQPQDYQGNNVGSSISVSPTPIIGSSFAHGGNNALFAAVMNVNNAAATTFKLDLVFSGNPHSLTTIMVDTVPLADLVSTTPGATVEAFASATRAITASLNTSAGGFLVCSAANTASGVSGSFSGSISGSTLTAGASTQAFVVGQNISSAGGGGYGNVLPATTISSQISGSTGGAGTYGLSGPTQNVGSTGASFTGQAVPIGGTNNSTLTVSGFSGTALAVGQTILGTGLPTFPNTWATILSFGTGAGGNGTYVINGQFTVGPEAMTTAPQSMSNSSSFAIPSSSSGENVALRAQTGGAALIDAANSAGATPASATLTFNDAGNVDMVCAAWR